MNERFLIPTAVAAALHALLFFGYQPVHMPGALNDGLRSSPVKKLPNVEIELVLPRDPDDPDTAAQPKGEPAEARPELPEPPPRDAVTEVPLPKNPPSIAPTQFSPAIPTGSFGDPNGLIGIAQNVPVRSDWLDNPPRTRTQVAPLYPYEARKTGRPGEVVVEFIVDESGRVLDPHVVRSNDPLFDEPTLRAVAKWRFEPGRRNGKVVRFRMAVPVGFAVSP